MDDGEVHRSVGVRASVVAQERTTLDPCSGNGGTRPAALALLKLLSEPLPYASQPTRVHACVLQPISLVLFPDLHVPQYIITRIPSEVPAARTQQHRLHIHHPHCCGTHAIAIRDGFPQYNTAPHAAPRRTGGLGKGMPKTNDVSLQQ